MIKVLWGMSLHNSSFFVIWVAWLQWLYNCKMAGEIGPKSHFVIGMLQPAALVTNKMQLQFFKCKQPLPLASLYCMTQRKSLNLERLPKIEKKKLRYRPLLVGNHTTALRASTLRGPNLTKPNPTKPTYLNAQLNMYSFTSERRHLNNFTRH